jgi:hypothetical protein
LTAGQISMGSGVVKEGVLLHFQSVCADGRSIFDRRLNRRFGGLWRLVDHRVSERFFRLQRLLVFLCLKNSHGALHIGVGQDRLVRVPGQRNGRTHEHHGDHGRRLLQHSGWPSWAEHRRRRAAPTKRSADVAALARLKDDDQDHEHAQNDV